MPYELPPDPSTQRRERITRWVSFGFAAILVALVTYFGYIAYEGSRQLTDAPDDSADCRTPAAFGWAYEPINYDASGDDALGAEPDPQTCAARGAPAGDALTAPDGVALAGWYIPSAAGAGPAGPTVVIAHGWGDNKSGMLGRAAYLHDAYNLVIVDFRNHGQSESSATTQGVREASDLRAVLDWLEATHGPSEVVVLGVSMGGATALRAAALDDRIDALVIESVHARLAHAAQARLERAGYPLAVPASWAILLGTLLRTGEDVTTADPITSVARLGDRPLLLINGALDASIGLTDADDLFAAAEEAGVPVELRVCESAGHAQSDAACAEDYPDWVLGFLERALAEAG